LWRNSNSSLLDDPIHDTNVFSETPAGGLETGCAAYVFVGGALCEGLMMTVVTVAARDVMEDHNPVAGSEVLHSSANGGDFSGSFVAEDARGGVRSGGDFLKIGAAHAAGMNAKKQFPGADLRNRNSFQADVVYATINRGEHGGGDHIASFF
jgi:hypothetical protein